MKIRWLKDWHGYPKGFVIDAGGGQADLLLRRGLCEQVDGAATPQTNKPAPEQSKPRAGKSRR